MGGSPIHFGVPLPDLAWLIFVLPLFGVFLLWVRDAVHRASDPSSKDKQHGGLRRFGEILGIVEPYEPPYLLTLDQDTELRRRHELKIEPQKRDRQTNRPHPRGVEKPRIRG